MSAPTVPAAQHRGIPVDLRGKLALVTGGASGIGAACARRLAAAGAEIIVADLDGAGAGAMAHELGGRAVQVDLSDTGHLDAVLAVAGDADIIVNNAGVQQVAPIEEFPPERFALILRLGIETPFLLVRAALPGMYERGFGRVINVSSVHGLRASPYKSAYVSAKHGLEGLSKVIALEGGGRGVTSNTICPGYVRTPLIEGQIAAQAKTHGISPEEVVAKIMLAEPAIKRLIEPAEVAEMAAYLCGPSASFINGTSIVMDGGWTAH